MPPQVATLACFVCILGLFWLARERGVRTSKALWLPLAWVLFALTASKWLQSGPTNVVGDVEGNPFERNIYTVLMVAGVIILLRRRREVWRLLRVNAPILLYFLYCLASVLWSDYPGVAFKRWIKAVGDLVMVLIVLTDADRLGAIKRFMARAGFLLIPVSILLIEYYPDLGRSWSLRTGVAEFVGVTNDKNVLGVICLLFGLGAVWRLVHALRERRRRRGLMIAYGSILVMVLWLFSKANSMTSLACFVLASGLIVAISFQKWARKRAVVNLLVVIVIVGATFPLFIDTGSGLLKTVGRDPSLTGRTEIWHELLEMHTNPIVGTGFESFWLGKRLETIWSKHPWHPNESHNGYLEVYLNLGLVGLFLLSALIIATYRNVLRMLRREPERGELSLACFVVEIIYSFTEAGFRLLNTVWFFFLLAAVAIPESRASETSSDEDSFVEDATPEFQYVGDEEGAEQVQPLQVERSEAPPTRDLDFGFHSQ